MKPRIDRWIAIVVCAGANSVNLQAMQTVPLILHAGEVLNGAGNLAPLKSRTVRYLATRHSNTNPNIDTPVREGMISVIGLMQVVSTNLHINCRGGRGKRRRNALAKLICNRGNKSTGDVEDMIIRFDVAVENFGCGVQELILQYSHWRSSARVAESIMQQLGDDPVRYGCAGVLAAAGLVVEGQLPSDRPPSPSEFMRRVAEVPVDQIEQLASGSWTRSAVSAPGGQ
jgi:hypothetical protein